MYEVYYYITVIFCEYIYLKEKKKSKKTLKTMISKLLYELSFKCFILKWKNKIKYRIKKISFCVIYIIIHKKKGKN